MNAENRNVDKMATVRAFW